MGQALCNRKRGIKNSLRHLRDIVTQKARVYTTYARLCREADNWPCRPIGAEGGTYIRLDLFINMTSR